MTGARNARRRIASIGALAGLVSTTGDGETAMRLHPLLKDYAEKRRFEEDAERYRGIQRGIALALARRGRAVEALRHAAEAGDATLLGRIAEGTGGVRLWLEQGLEELRRVDALLTGKVLSRFPRLALVRCVALTSSGDMEGAKRLYEAAAAQTDAFTRDREGGDDRALAIDHIFVQGLLHWCGCECAASMVLEHRAGTRESARAHLVDYLRLYAEADYARPAARERALAFDLLDEVTDAHAADGDLCAAASCLRKAMRAAPRSAHDPARPELTARELDVLARMERQRDMQIADALNLSYDGVRYRIRNIFAKLEVRERLDAVRRARDLDILPPAERASETEP